MMPLYARLYRLIKKVLLHEQGKASPLQRVISTVLSPSASKRSASTTSTAVRYFSRSGLSCIGHDDLLEQDRHELPWSVCIHARRPCHQAQADYWDERAQQQADDSHSDYGCTHLLRGSRISQGASAQAMAEYDLISRLDALAPGAYDHYYSKRKETKNSAEQFIRKIKSHIWGKFINSRTSRTHPGIVHAMKQQLRAQAKLESHLPWREEIMEAIPRKVIGKEIRIKRAKVAGGAGAQEGDQSAVNEHTPLADYASELAGKAITKQHLSTRTG